ncbi:MAG TPA: FtsW/RodA/SpoVE family cell cycle protein [Candidatus Paceibacterota bacterium]|jgi:rod shape determining protein RodA|nr:FtsW/RodA/SpoVE family cell cycle protein [Candidatus Paceibacterota bacterium]
MLALFIPLGILVAAGLITLSALSFHFFALQFLWVAIGVGLVIIFLYVDWRSIFNSRWITWALYAFALLLMLFAYLAGPVIRNARSWIVLGPFSVQPVEVMKVALIFLFAHYFSRRHLAVARWQNILTTFALFVIPAAIAVRLPDLGSALIFFSIWFGFLLLSGLPLRRVLVTLVIFALAAGFIWTYVLKDYHRARILGYLDPQSGALSINYSATQARIAIGSAGFLGKGYGQGTQTQLGFLSEPTEDFIFAALIEEWGVLGGIVVVAAFFFLIFQILRIGALADENFEKFICLGAAMMFGVQFLLNAGSATGLTPVVGVTFPFVSYGGTSMFADFFLVAVINSIRKRSSVA